MGKGKSITKGQVINVYFGYTSGLHQNALATYNNMSVASVNRIIKIMLTARDDPDNIDAVLGVGNYTNIKALAKEYFGISSIDDCRILKLSEHKIDDIKKDLNNVCNQLALIQTTLAELQLNLTLPDNEA